MFLSPRRRESRRDQARNHTTVSPRRRRASWRPTVELLEDRLTPATHVWGGAVSSSWSAAGNWSSAGVPAAGEDHLVIVFPAGSASVSHNDVTGLTVGEIDIMGAPADAASFDISGSAITLGNGTAFAGATGNPGNIEDTSGNPNDLIHFDGIALANSAAETLPPTAPAVFTGHDVSATAPGALTLASPLTGGAAANLTINFAPSTAITPSAGNGEVTLTGANSFGGTTAVGGGVLSVGNDSALGAADGTPATGTFLVSTANGGTGGNIELEGPTSTSPVHVGNEYLDLASTGAEAEPPGGFTPRAPSQRQFDSDTDGNSWAGPIVLDTVGINTTTFYTVAGTSLTLTGPVSGDAGNGLVKEGPGTLVLGGGDVGSQANTYAGLTIVNGGTLTLAKSTALGATRPVASGSDTLLTGSARLALTADRNGNPIAVGAEGLSVSGPAGMVRLENVSGNNSFAGPIQLATAATVQVDNAADTLTLTGVIGGTKTNGLTKQGAGTLALAANNTYPGATDVEAGTLDVNGAQAGNPVTIAAGGTLGGTGTTGPVGSSTGTQDLGGIDPAGPGAAGQLTVHGDVAFGTGSSFAADLPDAGHTDLLNVQGAVTGLANATLKLGNFGSLAAPGGTQFTILQATTPLTAGDHFLGLADGAFVPNTPFRINYLSSSVVLTLEVVPTLTASAPATAVFGQPVTITATVTDPTAAAVTPTGSVTFRDGVGGPALGPAVTLTPGATPGTATASLTTSSLSVAGHTIAIDYSGDSTFVAGTATAATAVGQAGTTATLTAAPTDPGAGGTVTLTAKVAVTAPGSGTPGGTVTFQDLYFAPGNDSTTPTSTTTVAAVNLPGSPDPGTVTTVTGPLTAGSHHFQAVYSGDTNFVGSTSPIAPVSVVAFTSAGAATFAVGRAGSFQVTAAGEPAPTLGLAGSDTLPGGVTFNAATGALGGIPAPGSAGTYTVHFTAASGTGTALQNFTLTVFQPVVTGPAEITALVSPQLGPLTPVQRGRRKVPGMFQQTVTITNTGIDPIQGSIVLVLDNLGPRKKVRKKLVPLVKVLNAGGTTQTVSPGSPFVAAGTSLLPPGGQTTFTLQFKVTGPGKPTFSPRILLGMT
jgi:autotransporter-associated beta strand protein